MPRVHVPPGTWIKCRYRTTTAAWHRLHSISEAQEIACKAAVKDIVQDANDRTNSGQLPSKEFWPTVRRTLDACIKAHAPQPVPPIEDAMLPQE